ncbi:hypothetical protein [Mesobacillus foraminis]|uniref:Uncharacterized protein n=1 Tax=Mesobacillus foraminis TaxID=279826 RepID=A0A4R2B2Y6_9BACI|nr:hypothetical protein [Mesobacillus foraminis]TCN20533.1 hypothetical protein EV146_114153 [Mesobacillus foraminis]
MNKNRVDYHLRDRVLLSTTIEHWDQYVASLRASDTVTIYKQEYIVNKINMVHDSQKIVLKVNIEPLKLK